MSVSLAPLSPARYLTSLMLRRLKRDYAPVSLSCLWNVRQTMEAIERHRKEGRRVGLTALFIKATATIMESHPNLNQRIFWTSTGPKRAVFDHISCSTLVARQQDDETVLVPLVIRDTNKLSVDQIHAQLKDAKVQGPEATEKMQRHKELLQSSRPMMKAMSILRPADPNRADRIGGTYAFAGLLNHDIGINGFHSYTDRTQFYVLGLEDRPFVKDDQLTIGRGLTVGMGVDHYLVDPLHMIAALKDLRLLIEDPSHLLGE